MTLSRMDKRKALQDSLGNETFDPREKRNEELENQFKFFQQQSGYENISDNTKLEDKQDIDNVTEIQEIKLDELFEKMESSLNSQVKKENNFNENNEIPKANNVNDYAWLENSVINRLENIDDLLSARTSLSSQIQPFENNYVAEKESNGDSFNEFLNITSTQDGIDEIKQESAFNIDNYLNDIENKVEEKSEDSKNNTFDVLLNSLDAVNVSPEINENVEESKTQFIVNAVEQQNQSFESFLNQSNNETALEQTNTFVNNVFEQENSKYANDNTFNLEGFFNKLDEENNINESNEILKGTLENTSPSVEENSFDSFLSYSDINENKVDVNSFEELNSVNSNYVNDNTVSFDVLLDNLEEDQNKKDFESFLDESLSNDNLDNNDFSSVDETVSNDESDNDTISFDSVLDSLNEEIKLNDIDNLVNQESTSVNENLSVNLPGEVSFNETLNSENIEEKELINQEVEDLFSKFETKEAVEENDVDNFLNDIDIETKNVEQNNSLDSLIEEIKKEDKLNATTTLIDIQSVTQTIFPVEKIEDTIEIAKINVEANNKEIEEQLKEDKINNTIEDLLLSNEEEELKKKANKKFNNILNLILVIFVIILILVLFVAAYYLLKTYAII